MQESVCLIFLLIFGFLLRTSGYFSGLSGTSCCSSLHLCYTLLFSSKVYKGLHKKCIEMIINVYFCTLFFAAQSDICQTLVRQIWSNINRRAARCPIVKISPAHRPFLGYPYRFFERFVNMCKKSTKFFDISYSIQYTIWSIYKPHKAYTMKKKRIFNGLYLIRVNCQ